MATTTIDSGLYPDTLTDGSIFIACGGYDSTNKAIKGVLKVVHVLSGDLTWEASIHEMAVDPSTMTITLIPDHSGRSGVSITSRVNGVTPILTVVGGTGTATHFEDVSSNLTIA